MRVEEGGAEKDGGPSGSAARLGVELRAPRPTLTSVNVEVVCRSYYRGGGRRRDMWADVDIVAGAGSAAELSKREPENAFDPRAWHDRRCSHSATCLLSSMSHTHSPCITASVLVEASPDVCFDFVRSGCALALRRLCVTSNDSQDETDSLGSRQHGARGGGAGPLLWDEPLHLQ